MAKLTWAQKLNNRLKRNWNVQLPINELGEASACGKRNSYDHSEIQCNDDEKYHRIYNALKKVTKKDHVTINVDSIYLWDENYMNALRYETEYYGTYCQYAKITVTTPRNRRKLIIDTYRV